MYVRAMVVAAERTGWGVGAACALMQGTSRKALRRERAALDVGRSRCFWKAICQQVCNASSQAQAVASRGSAVGAGGGKRTREAGHARSEASSDESPRGCRLTISRTALRPTTTAWSCNAQILVQRPGAVPLRALRLRLDRAPH